MADFHGKRVGLLLGGQSPEREVSLESGKNCGAALRRLGYDVLEIDVDQTVAERLSKVDVAFIALHGRWGEDGCIQGLCESLRVPYTGSGVLASALAMNKLFSKRLFLATGLNTAEFAVVTAEAEGFVPSFGYPCVVKPNAQGSSVGVSIVKNPAELPAAVRLAGSFGSEIIVEKYVPGREVNVAVIERDVLGTVEIRTSHEFYDYDAKYVADDTQYLVPAPMPPEWLARLSEIALSAYTSMGCAGAARVDAIVDAAGEPWLLEVNTLPGMTSHSLVPKIAAASGVTFDQLVDRILRGAALHA